MALVELDCDQETLARYDKKAWPVEDIRRIHNLCEPPEEPPTKPKKKALPKEAKAKLPQIRDIRRWQNIKGMEDFILMLCSHGWMHAAMPEKAYPQFSSMYFGLTGDLVKLPSTCCLQVENKWWYALSIKWPARFGLAPESLNTSLETGGEGFEWHSVHNNDFCWDLISYGFRLGNQGRKR